MKTLIKDICVMAAAVAVLLSSHALLASNPEPSSLVVPEAKVSYSVYAIQNTLKFRLALENQLAQNVSVKIYNQEGKNVYTDYIDKMTYLKRDYNLESLGKGTYRIAISAGDFTSSNQIEIGTKNTKTFGAFLSPTLKEDALTIAFQNASEGVYISLTDSNETILYSEQSDENHFARKYNLAKLPKGTYKMQITHKNKTIEQIYTVK